MSSFSLSGQIVDLHARRVFSGTLVVTNGVITALEETAEAPAQYILPGFVDAHVHIESSMLVPTAFARAAVVHGTVATVSDPHEIANVCGEEGVQFMIANAAQSPFHFFFGAPSCVPATGFETAGARLDAKAVAELLQRPDIHYLTEMMNFPGVLSGDPEVGGKLAAANALGKPIDGHAPGLRGDDARRYAAAGPSTDHECTTLDEALDKIAAGMHILIREGSAAKNFDALHPLLRLHPDRVMFCSDDKHPDELLRGHINELVHRALQLGYDRFDVLRAACLHPVQHYHLPVGQLRVGDAADFIVVDDLDRPAVRDTYLRGERVSKDGASRLPEEAVLPINQFAATPRRPADFALKARNTQAVLRTIRVLDGQLLTEEERAEGSLKDGCWIADPGKDLLKLVVINRYEPAAQPAIAFVQAFGLRTGALASTVAHDCHNLIAVGADDESLCAAVNALIAHKGGIAVARPGAEPEVLPLPVAGLMSSDGCEETGAGYARIDAAAKALGTPLAAPFTTLSFLALLVIPALKLSDLGLFDGRAFRFVSLEVPEE